MLALQCGVDLSRTRLCPENGGPVPVLEFTLTSQTFSSKLEQANASPDTVCGKYNTLYH